MPLISVFVLAISESGESHAVFRYFWNSLILVLSVGFLSLMIGVSSAFMMVRLEFRGRRWLEGLLIMPLALPAFLVAYALVEYLDFSGPLQTLLRAHLGEGVHLPKFRSIWGAILVLSFALYPYVYIYARQGLRQVSKHQIEVARTMGLSPWARFWRVELPLLRPAIAVGLSLVALETLADFGTVDHFGVETLSTGIFSSWLQAHQLGAAARMALVLALLSLGLVALEAYGRRRQRYVSIDGRSRPMQARPISGWKVLLVWVAGMIPVFMGFILPVSVFLNLMDWQEIPKGEWQALMQSASLGLLTALLILSVAFWINRNGASRLFQVIGLIGYSLPGAVLAIGIMIPLTGLDHHIADMLEAMGSKNVGLILTGSGAALVLAYVVRFFALGNGAISEGKARISPNLTYAARVMGRSPFQAFWEVERPQMMRPAFAGALLVFVDVIKELPATLILRPFGVETLATRLYEAAALENLAQASLSALLIALTGLISVGLIIRFS